MLRRTVGVAMAGLLTVGLSATVAGPAYAVPTAVPGSYQTVTPTRVLDTRHGIGGPAMPVAPLSTVTFTVPDTNPASIGAVLLEVTVVNPTASGYATVFGAGTPRPVVSNLNFQQGQNVPNSVIVRPSGTDEVSIFNGSHGTVDLLADIQGYFESGSNPGNPGILVPVTPARYLDTRSGLGTTVKGKVAPYSVTKLQVGGIGAVPLNASAVALNVTAVQGDGKGYVTAYPDANRPEVSTVNFYSGEDRANLTPVALGKDGSITLYNGSPYPVDLLADVTGYFTTETGFPQPNAAGEFAPLLGRILDTRREGTGSGYVPSLATLKVPFIDPTSKSGAQLIGEIRAVAVNVTAVDPQAAGFFTTWDGTTTVPAVSNVNFQAKRDSAGSVVVPLNPDGTISVYNGSFGNVDMLVDVTGVFTSEAIPPAKVQAGVRSALGSVRKPTIVRQR